ncbi:4861_t:CDS:1, partial [Cetraspora pellucida]
DNKFEKALWVAQHPRILNLAMIIQNAMMTQVSDINNNNKLFFNTGQSCNSMPNVLELNQ